MKRLIASLCAAACLSAAADLPVRGIHLMAPRPGEVPAAAKFIAETLPRHGINLVVLEINYGYRYSKRPNITDGHALSRSDAAQLVAASRKAGIRLMPMINLLGHQSLGKTTFALLRAHPEFDETPGRYPANEGIYCRSYCPLHPGVHAVVFDLIDELVEAFEADAFHIGMDEVLDRKSVV